MVKLVLGVAVLYASATVGLAAIPLPSAAQLHYQSQEIVALTHFKFVALRNCY